MIFQLQIKFLERKNFYVPQKVVILDQSLKSNIILSAPFKEFNESNYRNAIEKSGLTKVINKLKIKMKLF